MWVEHSGNFFVLESYCVGDYLSSEPFHIRWCRIKMWRLVYQGLPTSQALVSELGVYALGHHLFFCHC